MIHIFLTDRQTDTTSQIDVTSTGTPSLGHSSLAQGCVCGPPAISADGHYVVFTSAAIDLVPGDTNNDRDVFVRDVVGGTTTQESVDSAGSGGDNYSYRPSISGDGSLVAFESGSQNLVAGLGPTAPGAGRVYVHNRLTGTTTLESMDAEIGDYAGSAQIPRTDATWRSATTNRRSGYVTDRLLPRSRKPRTSAVASSSEFVETELASSTGRRVPHLCRTHGRGRDESQRHHPEPFGGGDLFRWAISHGELLVRGRAWWVWSRVVCRHGREREPDQYFVGYAFVLGDRHGQCRELDDRDSVVRRRPRAG